MLTFVEKNQKNFLNFGNSREIWVSVFQVKSFEKVESIFEQNVAVSAIGRVGSQHICPSFGTMRIMPGSLV